MNMKIKNLLPLIYESLFICLLVFALGIVFNALYPGGYKLRAKHDNVVQINTQMAYDKYIKGVPIFDARDMSEYYEIRIEKANPLPASEYKERLSEYRKIFEENEEILIYCSNDKCNLSHLLAEKIGMDYRNITVYIIQSGLEGWYRNAYPTKQGGEF